MDLPYLSDSPGVGGVIKQRLGDQRFGRSARNPQVGRALLSDDAQATCDLLLGSPQASDPPREGDALLATGQTG